MAKSGNESDDGGFPTSAELSRYPLSDKAGRSQPAVEDPWHKLREKKRKAKEKREKLLKRYRGGELSDTSSDD